MTTTKPKRRRVCFEIEADEGSEVFVAGSFNDWDPTRNQLKFRDGVYRTHLLLEPNQYQYKFVVNGVWCVDPNCGDWVSNQYGSLNSIRNVA